MWSFVTFLVSLPMCTLVGFGLGLLLFLSLSSRFGCFDLERERLRLSWRRREGLGDPEELLELELRDELELPDRLEADEELDPELDPELEPEDELEDELDRERLLLLLPLDALRLFLVLSRPRSFSPASLLGAFSLVRSLARSSERSLRLLGEGAIFPDFLCFSLLSSDKLSRSL